MKETTAPITLCCIMNSCEKSKSIKQTCQNLYDNLRKTPFIPPSDRKTGLIPADVRFERLHVFGGLLCTGQVRFRDSETTKGKKLEGKKASYI